MCGIVGYIGKKNAQDILLDGLKRLEYRGYDSAGVAIMNNGKISITRAFGKLVNLEKVLKESPLSGTLGIGHTRWATHGKPSERNAHPHAAGGYAVVHNGIIENYNELKKMLADDGHEFVSETDTEVICHLIWYHSKKEKDTVAAIRKAILELRGSYALAVIHKSDAENIYVAKSGSPIILGLGNGENFIASDIPALLPYTRKVLSMEDGELAIVSMKEIQLFDNSGVKVKRHPYFVTWNSSMAEKGGFKHYMLKEIFEQPSVLERIIKDRIEERSKLKFPEIDAVFEKNDIDEIAIVACGTSYHAALVGKYWIENLAKIPVIVDYSSEFRYRGPLIDKKTLVIPISQSGETADTLAALKLAKDAGCSILSLCNVMGSSIARLSDATVNIEAGPEIGVASTKAFTAQLLLLYMMALYLGEKKGRKIDDREIIFKDLQMIPRYLNLVLDVADFINQVSVAYSHSAQVLFIGRGMNYPVALEGALKLKEISYLHAEGFPAGELKHGPIALVDEDVCIIAIAPKDSYSEKIFGNIEEVKARSGSVVALVSQGDARLDDLVDETIALPNIHPHLTPILAAIPMQLIAYYIADYKGTDVDQPRNLAKSVTVE
ncbi:MAG: glutamine--fructose-6-phosphate transaminase (isomerizing) [Pseudomonadota bacterium]